MRVLLVQPDQNRTLGLQQLARVEPLGLETLAGALLGAHEVALLDLRVEPDGLERTLDDVRPDLVGISSTFTIDLPRTLAIARAVKAWDGRTFVVVGGHHVSLSPGDARDLSADWALLTDVAPLDQAGRYLGLSNTVTAGAGVLAVAIGGPIADFVNHYQFGLGYRAIFAVAALEFALGAWAVLHVHEPRAGVAALADDREALGTGDA